MLNFSKKFVSLGREYSSYLKHVNAPLFRKSFVLSEKPEYAEILITGLGFYRLFVNGKEITKGILAPYISNPDDIVYYDNYDLVPFLVKGENVIGVMLGDGMLNTITHTWNFDSSVFVSAPKLAFTFEAKAGGETVSFEADSMKCSESAVTFNNHRAGVHYDARLEKDGWDRQGYDDSDASVWRTPIKSDMPRGAARLCDADPIALRSEIAPVKVWKGEAGDYKERPDIYKGDVGEGPLPPYGEPPKSGGYIYDFGKNTSGIYRLVIKNAKPGQVISIQCAERLDKQGRVDYSNIDFYPDGYSQRDIYICRGDKEEEVFEPPFVYHGCRYLYVHGITEEQAKPELITYLEMNTELRDLASFECSDEVSNKIYAVCDNSDKSNFHYFPTDCPHREKNGWTGDAAASCEHMVMTLSVERSYREWMNNIRAAQSEDGHIPGIVPTNGWGFAWGNGPAWDRVIFYLPYYTYIYRGRTEMITENAHMMLSYLELITRVRDKRGIVNWGLGDWCPCGRQGAGGYAVPTGFTNGVMIMDMCRMAVTMFDAVGLTLHSAFAKKLGQEMKEAVRARYLDTATMTIEGRSQSGQAMAIYYDLLEEGEKAQALRVLLDLISEKGDFMSVGYLGIRALFYVLSESGEAELAYKLITRPEAPSYGYIVNSGMTSLPEEIITCPPEEYHGSLNHHFFGDVKLWYLREVCGIKVNPFGDDPDEIVIKPHFLAALSYAKGSYEARSGKISVEWKRDGDKVLLSVHTEGDLHVRAELCDGYVFAREYRTYPNDAAHLMDAVCIRKTV